MADLDSRVGEGKGQGVEEPREGRGIGGGAGGDQEIGGGAGPGGRGGEKSFERLDEGVRRRGLVDGIADAGMNGGGPGDGGDVTRGGGGDGGLRGETFRKRGAEGAEDFGEPGFDELVQRGLGDASFGGERRKIDDEGAGGDFGREIAGFGEGEDDGAADPVVDGLEVAGLAEGEAVAGGDAAERAGDGGGESRDVVEGEDPIVPREVQELAGGSRDGDEGSRTRVDQDAEDAGGVGFAGGSGATEDEHRIGSGGSQGGEKPGEDAKPGGGIGRAEVQDGAEGIERVGFGGIGELRRGQVGGAGRGFEGRAGLAGCEAPAGGEDFDVLAVAVGEIEEERAVGGPGGAAKGGDGGKARIAEGLGLEVAADGGPGMGGGDAVEARGGEGVEPGAEGGGADGEGAKAEGRSGGDAHEGAGIGGGEGEGSVDEAGEGVEDGIAGWG